MKNQKTGTVFVSKSKGDLSQGKGFVVTSYETLNDNIDQLTHWTPNTFLGGTYYDFSNRIIKGQDRKSTRLNSSHVAISYAVFCLKKKKRKNIDKKHLI